MYFFNKSMVWILRYGCLSTLLYKHDYTVAIFWWVVFIWFKKNKTQQHTSITVPLLSILRQNRCFINLRKSFYATRLLTLSLSQTVKKKSLVTGCLSFLSFECNIDLQLHPANGNLIHTGHCVGISSQSMLNGIINMSSMSRIVTDL